MGSWTDWENAMGCTHGRSFASMLSDRFTLV
jgi:hypothetical protein